MLADWLINKTCQNPYSSGLSLRMTIFFNVFLAMFSDVFKLKPENVKFFIQCFLCNAFWWVQAYAWEWQVFIQCFLSNVFWCVQA